MLRAFLKTHPMIANSPHGAVVPFSARCCRGLTLSSLMAQTFVGTVSLHCCHAERNYEPNLWSLFQLLDLSCCDIPLFFYSATACSWTTRGSSRKENGFRTFSPSCSPLLLLTAFSRSIVLTIDSLISKTHVCLRKSEVPDLSK